ncbi:UTP--glucose-1-phosphate uridylyltransferase [Dehalobacter sp. DCA]|uniref:UTP--glucose-1-phosphate uridylyltransferase GalU n=1 Tax=Dehalobacter sp. DCA TaxID=1147129 RepID=UPI00028B9C43|nr:UTP--glucose-1-phosphate uridylyltransferase GalU [Dehalobacter sp. DCA]AFV02083.1 UTP--glucose-1-phosphate uridylyltransferase [Dehalobacter sp. DCA]
MKIKKAVIPAAGLGTRFLPATKALPKEMLPIVDKPTIQYIVEEAIDSGIEDILIITGRGKWPIVDYFDHSPELEIYLESRGQLDLLEKIKNLSNMANIHYIRQNKPLGLGHAIYSAKSFVGQEPFAVLLGDDVIKAKIPATQQLINVAERTSCSVIGIQEVLKSDVHKYGIVDPLDHIGDVWRVKDLVEKPAVTEAPSRLAIMGRYVINPSIFKNLERIEPGAGGEIQLTDALKAQGKDEPVYACRFEGKRYDVGDKIGYLKATVEFALESPDLGYQFGQYLEELYLERSKVKQREAKKRGGIAAS